VSKKKCADKKNSGEFFLSTQVRVGIEDGLKHDSSIHCDELISLPKSPLTNFVGSPSKQKMAELDKALKIALDLNDISVD
jgi:mRNA interferase MazF